MVRGNFKNSHVFNFAILFKWRKSDARETYMFYTTDAHCNAQQMVTSIKITSLCYFLRYTVAQTPTLRSLLCCVAECGC